MGQQAYSGVIPEIRSESWSPMRCISMRARAELTLLISFAVRVKESKHCAKDLPAPYVLGLLQPSPTLAIWLENYSGTSRL
jgi:hypothetical protein